MLISFLFLNENICYGYSLEAPRRGASNEYHNICFRREIRKILCGYPLLSVAMEMYLFLKKKKTLLYGSFQKDSEMWFISEERLPLFQRPQVKRGSNKTTYCTV